jgi:hypothetical protein
MWLPDSIVRTCLRSESPFATLKGPVIGHHLRINRSTFTISGKAVFGC